MEEGLTNEQKAFRQTIREFAATELKPGAAQRDKTGAFPGRRSRNCSSWVFSAILPREYGGGGRDFVSYAIAVEELARADASVTITLLAHTLCASHINAFGSPDQKKRFLAPLAGGEKLGAWALSEPGAGSDAGGISALAVPDGDGWRLKGNKFFITNGSKADIFVIMASSDPLQGNKGISAFIVPGDTPGLGKGKNLGETRLPFQRHGCTHVERCHSAQRGASRRG